MPNPLRLAAPLAAALLVVATAACTDASADTATGGGVTGADLASFTGLAFREEGSFGLDRAELREDGTVLRVRFPAGSASNRAGGPEGGAQAYLPLPEPVDELVLRYRVRFPDGFDFVKGGKLPGLYGGTVTSGQRIPDGTDGFSTRYMWRAEGAGEVYAYLPTSVDAGTSLGRGCWTFPTGRWTEVEQHVRLDVPGASDGTVTVRVDGTPVLHRTGLTFRTTTDLRIEGVFLSSFFGGGDSSWATPVDQYLDLADVEVGPPTAAPAGPEDPACAGEEDAS